MHEQTYKYPRFRSCILIGIFSQHIEKDCYRGSKDHKAYTNVETYVQIIAVSFLLLFIVLLRLGAGLIVTITCYILVFEISLDFSRATDTKANVHVCMLQNNNIEECNTRVYTFLTVARITCIYR